MEAVLQFVGQREYNRMKPWGLDAGGGGEGIKWERNMSYGCMRFVGYPAIFELNPGSSVSQSWLTFS